MNKIIKTMYEASRVAARLKSDEPIKDPIELELYESNIEQLRDFIRSNVWKDMSNAIGGMLEQVQLDLIVGDTIDNIRQLQGNAKMLLFLAELPESMLDEMITDKQIQKEEDEDEDE